MMKNLTKVVETFRWGKAGMRQSRAMTARFDRAEVRRETRQVWRERAFPLAEMSSR
jgi:hypothetical protein